MTFSIKNILFICIAFSLILSLSKNIFDYHNKQAFYLEHEEALHKAESENKRLKSEIVADKDTHSVERQLRNNLNAAKPDEYVVLIPAVTPTVIPTPTPPESPVVLWFDLFFK